MSGRTTATSEHTEAIPIYTGGLPPLPPGGDFHVIQHRDITEMMLGNETTTNYGEGTTTDGDCDDTIGFLEAINTMYQIYPSMDKLITLYNSVPPDDLTHHLVGAAIFTQMWLQLKKNPDENREYIQSIQRRFVSHWNQFVG